MIRHRSAEFFAMVALPPTLGLKKVVDRLIRLLTLTDTTLVEFCSSTSLLYVGALLALPGQSLVTGLPLFATMVHVAPEWAWASAFIALGVLQSVANLRCHLGARRYAAFGAFALFGFIGFLGASVTPISLFGALCKVHAMVQALVYLKLGIREEHGEK